MPAVPDRAEHVRQLPGIGRYTAGAVAANADGWFGLTSGPPVMKLYMPR